MIKKDNSLEIIKEVNPVLEKVNKLEIIVASDLVPATTLLSQINKYADALKKDRLSLTAPLEESLKLIRIKYTPTEALLKDAVLQLKAKMSDFQVQALMKQHLEEEKIAKKLDSGYIKTETAISKMEAIDVVQNKIASEAGSVSFREEKDFEVEDISKVPTKYLLPNMVELRIAMKAGLEIEGCRYFLKQVIVNRR